MRHTPLYLPRSIILLTSAALVGCGGSDTVAPLPVASVAVSPSSLEMQVGDAQVLQAQLRDAAGALLTGRPVTWSTSSATIASIAATGLVTGLAPGSVTITATAEGKNATSTIVILGPVNVVQVTGPSNTVLEGGTLQLTAVARDVTARTLTRTIAWSSSQTAIATVSGTGLVTAVAGGTTQIIATSDGVSGQFTVNVTPLLAPVASVTVSSAVQVGAVGRSYQATATMRDAQGNTLSDRDVSWASSAPLVATVSQTGLVSFLSSGIALISATSETRVGSREFYGFDLLAPGTPVTIAAQEDESVVFLVDVPAGTTRLTLTTEGESGDADLYVYFPTTTDSIFVACESYGDTSAESCVIENPQAGLWIVEVYAYKAFQGVQLLAELTSSGSGAARSNPGTREPGASDGKRPGAPRVQSLSHLLPTRDRR
jgi:uncharacterized protein YjdB